MSIKRPTSTTLTGIKPATTSVTTDLATELATDFPSNPPNYDPSQFGGLTYEQLATKLAALQPPDFSQKPVKKKNHTAPIMIDPSPKKKKTPTLPPSTPEDEQK